MPTLTPRQPRKRPAPSTRDQEIYLAYQTAGKTQAQLAEKYELNQSRVSQIVRKIAAWRSKANPRDEGELTTSQQQRLDRWLEHKRLEEIIRLSLQFFHHEQRTLTTTTLYSKAVAAGDDDAPSTSNPNSTFQNLKSVATIRELPANVQFLKTALRAQEQLSKLEEKPYLPAEEPDQQQRLAIMRSELRRLRDEAEETGKVTHSNNPYGIIKCFLDALVGQLNDARQSDPAMGELAAAILPTCDRPADLPLPPGYSPEDCEDQPDEEDDQAADGHDEAVGCEPHESEAPAWECEAPAEPSTPHHSPNPLSTNHAPDDGSPQLPAAEDLASPQAPEKSSLVATNDETVPHRPTRVLNPKSKIQNPKSTPPRPPSLSPNLKSETSQVKPPLNPYTRMLLREQKLDDLRDHIRSGLPFQMEWDPELGPPPVLSHHLDDPGCQYTQPSKQDDTEMVKDYLAKLRAEQLANA